MELNKVYQIDAFEGLKKIDQECIAITDPPYPNGAGVFDDCVADGYAVLYYLTKVCSKIVFFWGVFGIPTPPYGWYEISRSIWHKPNGQSAYHYENIIIWAKTPELTTHRVLRVPIINYETLPEWECHPTQKPIKLMRKLVEITTKEGAIVIDPFCGSGSTLVACKQLNRQFIGFEIEKKYVDIANKRLAQNTLIPLLSKL